MNKESFADLKKVIVTAAANSGQSLFCNGGIGHKQFRCSAVVNRANCKRVKELHQKRNLVDLRHQSLVNDRQNNRAQGKRLVKKTQTSQCNRSCPFVFTIKFDIYGFYIQLERKAGNPYHNYHPSRDPNSITVPKRLLTAADEEVMLHLANSCCSTGVRRNYMYSKLGRLTSRSRAGYMFKALQSNHGDSSNVYDAVLDYFQQNEDIAYTILWDVPLREFQENVSLSDEDSVQSSKLLSHTKFDKTNMTENDLSNVDDMQEMAQFARDF